MQPSVGRIVHYVSYGSPIQPDGSQAFESKCRAAVITDVYKDDVDREMVSLCVMNPDGLFFHKRSVEDTCYLDGKPEGGTWHWPERT